ncbi:hypothetical protein LTR84_002451 [Exophiala bonariae]|uniref:Lysophospholipase n=1 Tax=Exophiala bonariae TaxID=1690606 RepID=A0AAV9N9H6_9EURO|nr:hypothetical protein LTR84_002451 [Exophiala bonariae]
MARGSKRTLEEIANHEESDDDDYDDHARSPAKKSRSSKNKQPRASGNPHKKPRREYGDSDIDSDDDDLVPDDSASEDDFEDDEPETNENGRPMRRTAKKAVKYEEEDTDEDESDRSASEKPKTPIRKSARKKLIITLRTTPRPIRSTRKRSDSYAGKHALRSPSVPQPTGTRRSSRLSHDDEEGIFALTNSGKHVEVIRAGSRDPEDLPPRSTTGGKGLKYPSKSTIDEEPESVPKDEAAGEEEEEADEELEIKASQHELLESDPPLPGENDAHIPQVVSDLQEYAATQSEGGGEDAAHEPSEENPDQAEDDEEDEIIPRGRPKRSSTKRQENSPPADAGQQDLTHLRVRNLRSRANDGTSGSRRRKAQEESSDFDPEEEPQHLDEMSTSGESDASPRKNNRGDGDYESSNAGRRSTRLRSKAVSRQMSDASEELAAEVAELKRAGRKTRREREEIIFEPRRRRAGKQPNYDLLRSLAPIEDEEAPAAPSPSQRARKPGAGSWQRSLFNTYGPFGGGGGAAPVLGGSVARAQGGVDSDSSDDEGARQPGGVGGAIGMTPTTAGPLNLFPQTHNADPAQAAGGTPANLGKLKDKQALADADPLGVDQNVNFDSVGGLQGHIDQLKEMVALPLLYPEIFMRFKITPPRGVLFHGPPGTGKTLLARALATSVSSQGRKVTFYMRKGADALSKWVGEAERQLRLLFEEARKTQPSIIFFDEIDGLAPVRSSKQEQIHASIVSTLLALMDGMDGRGQVIVIGATNRPDSIDPALRRPGRFDREFYFPLPGTEARRAIIDIHTKEWKPELDPAIKNELAMLTKGYGGADLRALCTEAALNAVQRRYPQIYSSVEKLKIDPQTIEVTPKDFMISIKKMTPSSERSTSSGASPLPESVAPLLQKNFEEIRTLLSEVLPQKKTLTALEEAQFEDVYDGQGFGKEKMQQAFETSRVFRPRLLIHGKLGMGQQYLAAALLNHFEGLHVQSFDLPTLLSDTTSTPEATVIRLFTEVKMHKPSVIYIPNVQDWYSTVGATVISTFLGLLRSIKPTDPVLLLGLVEGEQDELDESMRRELFGYSKRNQYELKKPGHSERLAFFQGLQDYIRTAPPDFPNPTNRKKRQLEKLDVAPPEPEKSQTPLSKEELKAQKKKDRQTLNMLKIRLQPIMDQIRTRHKKFRTGVIDESQIRYLFEEADPGTVTSDLHHEILARASFRPFEIGKDAHGTVGLLDQANGNFYYNLDSVTIEKRLSNGYYKRPKDFLADIKRLAKDAKAIGDEDRLLKANELLANVEVDIGSIEFGEPAFAAECERVYQRELTREKEAMEKARLEAEQNRDMPPPQVISNVPHGNSGPSATTTSTTGPILLGEPMVRHHDFAERLLPTVPSAEDSTDSVMTNGVHHGHDHEHEPVTNGSSSNHGADAEEDTPMGGTDADAHESNDKSNETQPTQTTSSYDNRESAQPRPFHAYTAPSQHLMKESGMSAPRSQTGPFTPMPAGSIAAEFQNDASTTQSSDKRMSSGDREQGNTQGSGPNLYMLEERRSAGVGSDIPDTQDNPLYSQGSPPSDNATHLRPIDQPSSSQGQQGLSQPPVPPFDAHTSTQQTHRPSSQILDLLNPSPQPNLIQVEQRNLTNFQMEVADKTTGLSVEQLEQVNSVLMDTLWQTRGEWDRGKVLAEVGKAFNNVMTDMQESGQDFGPSSWGRKNQVIAKLYRLTIVLTALLVPLAHCLRSFLTWSNYAPVTATCPSTPLIRNAEGLCADEYFYQFGRRRLANRAFRRFIQGINHGVAEGEIFNYNSTPVIALASSGGELRGFLSGAGVMQAFDARDSEDSDKGVKYLYQAASYHVGLDCGAMLVAALAGNDNWTVSDLYRNIWSSDFTNPDFLPDNINKGQAYGRMAVWLWRWPLKN